MGEEFCTVSVAFACGFGGAIGRICSCLNVGFCHPPRKRATAGWRSTWPLFEWDAGSIMGRIGLSISSDFSKSITSSEGSARCRAGCDRLRCRHDCGGLGSGLDWGGRAEELRFLGLGCLDEFLWMDAVHVGLGGCELEAGDGRGELVRVVVEDGEVGVVLREVGAAAFRCRG